MTTTNTTDDDLIQFRFTAEDETLDSLRANEVADSISGLIELLHHLAMEGALGEGPPPEVRVRPPKHGSFILEAAIQWVGENPEGAYAVGTGTAGTFAHYIGLLIKQSRNEVTNYEDTPDGQVKLQFKDGAVEEVSRPTWKALKKQRRKTKRALRKLLRPLNDDAEDMEVRHGSSANTTQELEHLPIATSADADDYQRVALDEDEVEESVWTFDTEATVLTPDFRAGQKWRIEIPGEPARLAIMDDEEFFEKLDRDHPVYKNEIFNLTIREVSTRKNGRLSREWTIEKVNGTRRGGANDDGDSEAASE